MIEQGYTEREKKERHRVVVMPGSNFTRRREQYSHVFNLLASWCFQPSPPQRILSGLKANFSLSPTYSAHKSSNEKLSKIYEISPDT